MLENLIIKECTLQYSYILSGQLTEVSVLFIDSYRAAAFSLKVSEYCNNWKLQLDVIFCAFYRISDSGSECLYLGYYETSALSLLLRDNKNIPIIYWLIAFWKYLSAESHIAVFLKDLDHSTFFLLYFTGMDKVESCWHQQQIICISYSSIKVFLLCLTGK